MDQPDCKCSRQADVSGSLLFPGAALEGPVCTCARVVLSQRWSDWMAEGLTGTPLPLACDLFSIFIMFPNMFPLSEARLGAKYRNILWGAE